MFEVPSACLQAREIMDLVDFASVGSNDLVQYLFAVDRDNERDTF
jgi:phosphoenolpyruvate-protein kinase (PTS system EI component)